MSVPPKRVDVTRPWEGATRPWYTCPICGEFIRSDALDHDDDRHAAARREREAAPD